MMMFPSITDFKNAIKMNYIHNFPITIEDINIAEDIFGKDIYILKGKTTRQSPYAVTIDTIKIPNEVIKLHNNIFMGIDIMYVNGLAFL